MIEGAGEDMHYVQPLTVPEKERIHDYYRIMYKLEWDAQDRKDWDMVIYWIESRYALAKFLRYSKIYP